MNPVLPLSERVPDAEARVFDGRVYFYGSYDGDPWRHYGSDRLHVFSTDDLVRYTDHGVVITSAETDSPNALIYAPDCVCKDGRYYLYFACSDDRNYVAVADSPAGPFRDCTQLSLPVNQIDPAVLVDDDGSAWLYWGQFDCHCARFTPDMRHVEPDSYVPSLLNERDHGFHEGASIRKIGGTYILAFSDIARGRPTCLSYATSARPDGPFVKQGVLVDVIDCDPESWNDHGSVFEWDGRWYVAYHRSSKCREGQRRLCVDPIAFADGRFAECVPTTNGAEPPLDPRRPLPAVYACTLRGKARMIDDERFLWKCEDGDRLGFRSFGFGGETRAVVRAATQFEGCALRLRLDSPDGDILGEAVLPRTGGWVSGGIDGFVPVEIGFPALEGVHAVYLEPVCLERRWMSVGSICFA